MDVGDLRDAFVCHASEDKVTLVRPLVNLLESLGFRIWYDEFSLAIGDSLFEAINKGLADSDYGVIVLSPDFLKKKWPQEELKGLFAKEMALGKKVLIPVWHNISRDDLMAQYPMLADRIAANSSDGVDIIASQIADAMGSPRACEFDDAKRMITDMLELIQETCPRITKWLQEARKALEADGEDWNRAYRATESMTFAQADYLLLKKNYEQTYKYTLPYKDLVAVQGGMAPILSIFGQVSAEYNSTIRKVVEAQKVSGIVDKSKNHGDDFVSYEKLSNPLPKTEEGQSE